MTIASPAARRSVDGPWWTAVLLAGCAVFTGVVIAWFVLAVGGDIDPVSGDATTRLMGAALAESPWRVTVQSLTRGMWTGVHESMQAMVLSIFSPATGREAISIAQGLSVILFAGGAVAMSAVVGMLRGRWCGVLTLLFILVSGVAGRYLYSGLTEVDVFFLAPVSLLLLVIHVRRGGWVALAASGLVMSVACLVRNDAIGLAFGTWLGVVLVCRWRMWLAWGVLAAWPFLLRLGVSAWDSVQGGIGLMGAVQDRYDFGSSWDVIGRMVDRVWHLEVVILVTSAVTLGAVFISACLSGRMARSTSSRSDRIGWAIVLALLVQVLLMYVSIRAGNMTASPRYWLPLVPFAAGSAAWLAGWMLDVSADRRIPRGILHWIMLGMVILALGTSVSHLVRRARLPDEQHLLADWLLDSGVGNTVAWDYLHGRSTHLMALSARLDEPFESWWYNSKALARVKPAMSPPEGWHSVAAAKAASLIRYIDSGAASVVVMPSAVKYRGWREGGNQAHHLHNGGYLRPFVGPSDVPGAVRLTSPATPDIAVDLVPIFETETFAVFRPAGALGVDSTRFDRREVSGGGHMLVTESATVLPGRPSSGEVRIDRLGSTGQLMEVTRMSVPAGARVTGELDIRGATSGTVEVRLARHGSTPPESSRTVVQVGPEWTTVVLDRVFAHAHEQVRVQILLTEASPETIWVRGGVLDCAEDPD